MSTLRAEPIAAELARVGMSSPVTVAPVTESTNDDARLAAEAGAPHGAAFLADHQRGGRGRQGRRWHSPPGENLYLSLVARPALPPARLAPIALVAGVAVARLVDAALGRELGAGIKWPNDVLVDGAKIAGVLVETSVSASRPAVCIVGVGLNVLSRAFPSDPSYASPPTSLALAGASELDRERLAAHLIVGLRRLIDAYVREGLACLGDDLVQRDVLLGRRIAAGEREGKAAGIDAAGALLIDIGGVRHPVVSGAVRLL